MDDEVKTKEERVDIEAERTKTIIKATILFFIKKIGISGKTKAERIIPIKI